MSAKKSQASKSATPVVVLHDTANQPGTNLFRLVPASLVSVVAHLALFALFFLFSSAMQTPATPVEEREEFVVNAEPPQEARKETFESEDFDPVASIPNLSTNYDLNRQAKFSIPGEVDPTADLGVFGGDPNALPTNMHAPGSYGGKPGQGGPSDRTFVDGNMKQYGLDGGVNELGKPLTPGGINGRSGGTREFFLLSGGGTTKSEVAVTKGLNWLARQQLSDGRWMLNSPNLPDKDRGAESNDVAATALGLLPMLAAGKTHRPAKDNAHDKVVDKGLKFLLRSQDKNGYFGVSMYAHGLATIAICEAYGLTQDPLLRPRAQSAVNLIINSQHETGGWRYGPSKQPGDMSISGWQIMAIKSAQMAGLDVPSVAVVRAKAFLNSCANADEGYGYIAGQPSTPRMTAVALLCREYMENWGPAHPRLIKSITNHLKTNPPDRQDVYYYYYATQVMHHFGGDAWRDWNDKMRESLIQKQDQDGANAGSWSAAGDPYGRAGGRLMMTSLNLLTLEVYYRYLPLYYRDAGYKMDGAVKKAL
jgi:hypothetical protein